MNSMRNNSQMIIKIAQRVDEVREDLRKVSGKTDSFLNIKPKNICVLKKINIFLCIIYKAYLVS